MSDTIEATIVPTGTGPDIAIMDRADAPAIWQSYSEKAAALIERSKAVVVTDCSQVSLMRQADELRKECKSVRCEIERKRKELTEGFVKQTKAINAEAGKLWDLFEAEEKRLLDAATFAEREEARQKEELRASRGALLLEYTPNAGTYPLATMPDGEFQDLLAGMKAAHEAKLAREQKAKEEAAAQAEAETEERERVRLENEQLKAQAEADRVERERIDAETKAEREKAAQALREERKKAELAAHEAKMALEAAELKERLERQKAAQALRDAEEKAQRQRDEAERARQQAEAMARAEREAMEQKARDEAAAAAENARNEREAIATKAKADREKADAAAQRELEARLRAEAALRADAEAKAKVARDAEESARKAAAAPDKQKLAVFAAAVRALVVPDVTTEAGLAVCAKLFAQREKFALWVEKESASL